MRNELYHYGTPKHSGRYPWGSGEDPFHHGESAPGWFKRRKKKEQETDSNNSSDLAKSNKHLLDESISRATEGLDKSSNVRVKRADTNWRKGTDWDPNKPQGPEKQSEDRDPNYVGPRVRRKQEAWKKGTDWDPNKPQNSEKQSEETTNYKVKREDTDRRKGTEQEENPEVLALPAPKDQGTNFTFRPSEPQNKWESSSKQNTSNNKKKNSESASNDDSAKSKEDAGKEKAKTKQAELDRISGYRDVTSNAKSGVDALGKIAQRVETNQSLNARNQRFMDAAHMDEQALDTAIKRMEKEQKYVNLTGNYINKGRTSVSDVLATTGDILAVSGAVLGVAYTIKKLMD